MKFPEIGFGVYNIPQRQTAKCVYEALDVGYRLIDTAQLYGNEAETMQGIQNWLKDHPHTKRSEIIYTTKLWDSDFGRRAKYAVEDSYEKAGREPIDLFLMHSSGQGTEERLETWRILQEAVDDNKIRHLGVSNWGEAHLAELLAWPELRYKPVANEIEVNPWKQMTTLVNFCHQHDIVVLGYSPLILGKQLHDKSLVELAQKYSKTPAQILLRWIIERGVVPLPKTTKPSRMRENFGALDFKLGSEELGDANKYIMALPGWDPTKWR